MKKKFAFLAPQSALGFKDRSTGARFDVSVLLIQNTAAAKLKPVTQQGLARVSRSFGPAVGDTGVRCSANWGVKFCWRTAAQARPWARQGSGEFLIFDRFRKVMKGGVAAGLLLNKLGGPVMEAMQRAAESTEDLKKSADRVTQMLSVPAYWSLLSKMGGLARGVLDRNVTVGFGVCLQLYQQWLREERDSGNYVHAYRAGEHGDRETDEVEVFLDWVGSSGEVVGHFNVSATQEITGRLARFSNMLEDGDTVMAAGFDVKEMYVRLKPSVVLTAVEYVVQLAMRGQRGVLVKTRGRRGVNWYTAGTPRRVAVQMTTAQILAGVRFILENGYLFVAGCLVRQVCGIGIGGGASAGLAQRVCVYGEMEWTKTLGADNRLSGIQLLGVRLMDDCSLLATTRGSTAADRRSRREIFYGYVNCCYPDGVTVEQTSEGLSWVFCGMQLTVGAGGVDTRMTMKNVLAGVTLRRENNFSFSRLLLSTQSAAVFRKWRALLMPCIGSRDTALMTD
ncbi:hypothetical protein CYMTET_12675 [Cymbomonas tetramitiformis]|uniref:Uncharacterized protein n=1 Tax=Cymbomonas tetramitiformis TaxID=36881 RepID=A0AAE0GJZ9_9CHLO|nr:hypothetical protein CYMTET_12675 [Cymbomonas tetramitiformis]